MAASACCSTERRGRGTSTSAARRATPSSSRTARSSMTSRSCRRPSSGACTLRRSCRTRGASSARAGGQPSCVRARRPTRHIAAS
eukprot:4361996-Prymnesium_polylepis.1